MIEFSNVCLTYNGASRPALEGISLTIADGEAVAVVGPSGSGKTSFVRLLNALNLPTAGRVTVDGLDTSDPANLWEVRRRVGLIFQNPDNQLVSTTVERELAFGMENLGLPPAEIAARIEVELGDSTVLSTGGLAGLIAPVTECIEFEEPWLTLHGLRLIWEMIQNRD